MSDTSPSRANPYVGPRAFQRGEVLYGRDREVMELLDLLIAERIVLLYSPSGAGKTSLVQAALIPRLEEEDFQVLPPMRASLAPSEGLPASVNCYVLSLLLSLEEALPPEEQTPLAELATLTFGDYLDRRAAAGGPEGVVLIFDQFEEMLTLNPADRAAKAEFFGQVGTALRNRQRWALFSMREEFVAGLDPYLNALPTRLSTTYRLELLGLDAAREAMQKPARAEGIEFTDAAAERLAGDLATVRVQQPDGNTTAVPGDCVEPVQLQVVCRRLWDRLPPEDAEIGLDDVEDVGDVDAALRGYYAEQVAAVAAGSGVGERAIRDWFDRQLITEQGIRGQVLQGPERSQGLENQAIWPLVDAHLVRAEVRRGATWFELAHDRLIGPVQADNALWRQAHLSPLQRQAALWEEQGRQDGSLLRGGAMAEAEAWANTHGDELAAVEREFLEQCRKARARAEREKRLAVAVRVFGIVAFVLAIVAGLAGLAAWRAAEREAAAAVTAVAARDAALARGTAEAAAKLSAEWSFHGAQTAEARALAAASAEATAKLGAETSFREAQTAEAQALSEAAARAKAEQQALDSQATVAALLQAVLTLQAPTATPTPTAIPPGGTGTPTATPRFSPTRTATPTPNRAATATAESIVRAAATRLVQLQATQTAMARPTLSPTPTPAARPALPAGAQIVFISTRPGGSNLFVMGADGEGQRGERPAQYIPIGPCNVFFAGCFRAGAPAFQPGTSRFIFHSKVPQPGDSPPAYDIFLVELADGKATVTKNLTDSGVRDWDQMEGTWSADGRQIAFLSTYGDLNRIWLMRHDGLDRKPLTSGKEYKDEQPAWSPAGNWIAASTQKGGSGAWEITLIDPADGDVRRPVTSLGGVNRAPAWSPDGQRLAFGHGPAGPENICVVNVDGSGLRCYATVWPEDMPAWSPDGNWIAFHRYVDDTYRTEIFVMRSDFSEEIRLTYQEADDWGPVWVP